MIRTLSHSILPPLSLTLGLDLRLSSRAVGMTENLGGGGEGTVC
jgi:hypothetical protein